MFQCDRFVQICLLLAPPYFWNHNGTKLPMQNPEKCLQFCQTCTFLYCKLHSPYGLVQFFCSLWKNCSCLFTPNCTRNHLITYATYACIKQSVELIVLINALKLRALKLARALHNLLSPRGRNRPGLKPLRVYTMCTNCGIIWWMRYSLLSVLAFNVYHYTVISI